MKHASDRLMGLVGMVMVVALMVLGASNAGAATVFEDDMNDMSQWTGGNIVSTSDPIGGTVPTHAPYMRANNGVSRADFDHGVTSGSEYFKLSFKGLHTLQDNRLGMVWITNGTGTEGYGIYWTTSPGGPGTRVQIRKWDSTSEPGFFQTGTGLTGNLSLPGDETTLPFFDFEFEWTAATGQLTLSVLNAPYGPASISAIDTDFNRFSRIYLHGNTYVLYDEIIVEAVPEPAMISAVLAGLGVILGRRRSLKRGGRM